MNRYSSLSAFGFISCVFGAFVSAQQAPARPAGQGRATTAGPAAPAPATTNNR